MIKMIKAWWTVFYFRITVYVTIFELAYAHAEKSHDINGWILIILVVGINQIIDEMRLK